MKSDKYLLATSTYALAISNSNQTAKVLEWLLTEATENTSTYYLFIQLRYVIIVTFTCNDD